MILFDVTIEAKDDRRKEATGLLRRTMAGSQAEEGCLIYRFTADLDDPRLFHLVELWESEAAFAGHATGAPFRNFLAELPLVGRVVRSVRSEEHTSELQSLMRISYAVFCLINKNSNISHTHRHNIRSSSVHSKSHRTIDPIITRPRHSRTT